MALDRPTERDTRAFRFRPETQSRVACLLCAGVLAVSGCERAGPLRPVQHLVAARYQQPGDPSTGALPTAVVGGERRPVLANSSPLSLVFFQPLPPRSAGEVTVRVPIPEALRRASLDLSASLADPAVQVVRQEPRRVESPGEQVELHLELRPEQATNLEFVSVIGRSGPAETHYVSPPLEVPRGARLRFGVGLDESAPAPAARPPIRFILTVIDDSGEQMLWETRLEAAATSASRRWDDQEVGLSRYAGRSVRLRFESAVEGWEASAPFVFPVWSDPTVLAPDGGRKPLRNLLLISLDTLRADHLGCYGYGRPTSPTIDHVLAAQGTVFERAYSHFPGTTGSHMTLFTSLYPCVHGVTNYYSAPLRADAHVLAEVLRAAGYATAAFTEDGRVTASSGFARGFGTFVENATPNVNEPSGQADVTFRNALGWIEAHATLPWFVFVHTYQVHYPYAPPSGYVEQVAPAHGTDRAQRTAALYDGEVRYTDDLLAELLAGVDASERGAETLVVLVSDHGEQFGEHGLFTHGNSLYDELLHVPLIVRSRGLVPAGKRIGMPVGLIDVVPTVTELLGVPAARWVQGRSLVPLLEGRDLEPVTLYATLPLAQQVAARTETRKWIIDERTGRAQVFDTHADPDEKADLGPRAAEGTAGELLSRFHVLCAASQPSRAAADELPLDPAVRDKLRALGYVD